MPVKRVERSLFIRAPAERIFQLLTAPERSPEWLVNVHAVKRVTPGPIGPGSETRSRVEALGRVWDAKGRCVALEPPRRFVVDTILGPGLRSRSDSRLEDMEDGTTLHASVAYERPGGPLGALMAATGVERGIERDFDASLARLKALVEREHAGEPGG